MTQDDSLNMPFRARDAVVDEDRLKLLEVEAQKELVRITDWWVDHAPCPDGGFWGAISEAGQPVPDAPRSIILNTRLLWFFSSAYAATQHAACLHQAERAFGELKGRFFDRQTSTFVWLLSPDGILLDGRKQTYAQAFAIYALSAFAQATLNREALDLALTIFHQVQRNLIDPVHGGWIEALGPDLEPIEDVRLSEKDLNAPKSMNTHLHILEAYTALHALLATQKDDADQLEAVSQALKHAFDIMGQHIVRPQGDTMGLFFDLDWQSQSNVRSFGHDIEASWLLYEAGAALNSKAYVEKAKQIAMRLAYGALDGLSAEGGLYEEAHADGHVSKLHVWWIQAEALVGFLNAFELNQDPVFLKSALCVWDFISKHQIDRAGGEWLELSRIDDQSIKMGLMAGPWKCPYHTGRAMIETVRICQKLCRPRP